MKKLLISVLALTMSVTCAFGLAACDKKGNNGGTNNGGTSNADAAQAAITMVKTMYQDKSADTPVDYQVAGKVLVSGTPYTVNWSVSDEVAELVKIGEINSDNEITVSVDRVEAEVEYTLTASVTVGDVTKDASFNRVIPVVYKASEVEELCKDVAADSYYKVDGKEKKIYVEGYVIDTGTWGAQYSNFTNVYVADSAEGTKDDALLVYRLNTDTTFIKSRYDFIAGSAIVVGGYVQNYKGNNTNSVIELTYPSGDSNDNPTAVYYDKVEMSDTDLLNWMLDVEVNGSIIVNKLDSIILATSPVSGVSFNWAITSGNESNYVSLSGGALVINKLPTPEEGDATVKLTVTASLGSTSIPKEVTVTLKATIPGSIIASVNIKAYAEENSWDHASTKYQTVNIDENVTATTEEGGNNNGKYYSTGVGSWRLYKSENAHLTISVAAGYKLLSVTITYVSGAFEGVTSGAANVASGKSVSYTVTENVQINAIEVVYVALGADEHDHVWSYDYNASTWTHTKTCTAPGCDLEGEAATVVEECEPVLNICPDCNHEYSESDVLSALFALESGKSLKGTYKLTGVVTSIDEEYSTQYKNVTFSFQVGDKTVKAYRLNGTYADTVKVGDTVTVTGVLKNYDGTKEFDTGCKIATLVPGADTRTDAEKVEAEKNSFKLTNTQYTEPVEGIALPSESGEATLVWSVKNADDEEYATISGNVLTIIKLPVEGTKEVTLTVKFTIGDAHAEKDIVISILSSNAKGTRNNPYTTAEALAVIKALPSDGYTDAPVYVIGYVVDLGGWNSQYSNFTNVYIADSLTSNKTSADALQLFRLYPDGEVVKGQSDLELGAKIIAVGYLQNYKGNTPEMTYKDSDNPILVSYTAPTNVAKATVALTYLEIDSVLTSDYTIPASTIAGVTFKATNSSNSAITIVEDGAKLQVVRPDGADATVEITITATCNGETATKTYTITVTKAPTAENPDPVCLAEFALGTDKAAGTAHNDGTSKVNTNNAYTETVNGHTLTVNGGPQFYINANDATGKVGFKLGSASAVGSFNFTVDENVKKVVIYVAAYKTASNKAIVSVNGGTSVTINDIEGGKYISNDGLYYALEIDTTTTKTVEFATVSGGTRCMVNTIEYWGFEAGSDTPVTPETPKNVTVNVGELVTAETLTVDANAQTLENVTLGEGIVLNMSGKVNAHNKTIEGLTSTHRIVLKSTADNNYIKITTKAACTIKIYVGNASSTDEDGREIGLYDSGLKNSTLISGTASTNIKGGVYTLVEISVSAASDYYLRSTTNELSIYGLEIIYS